jgi:hypothetical protein
MLDYKKDTPDEDDFLIEKWSFETATLESFVKAGEDKGEVALMFELLNVQKPNKQELIRLFQLKKKFEKNPHEDVQFFLSFLDDLDE